MTNRDLDNLDAPPPVPEPVVDPAIEAREPGKRDRISPGLIEALLLLAIVAVALLLRFRGIQWGTGYYLHPDELFMTSVVANISFPSGFGEYLDSATSPLNPFNHGTGYIYGTFPLFAAKFIGSFTDYTAVHNAHIPGRWLSAIADTGTVVMVWWAGRMLWNRWTGLLAALLMAFTVLNIGAAHYFTTDSWSTFFAAASFAFVLAAWKHPRWVFYALAGIMVGLAAASKPTLFAAFGFLVLPALETIRLSGWRGLLPRWSNLENGDDRKSFPVILASALAFFVAIWTIRLAQPYMFEGPSLFSFRLDSRWVADVDFWRVVQSGEFDYYPGVQWAERTPMLYILKNMVLWGMGPGLGLLALGGLGWHLWTIVAARRWPSWITLGLVGWVCFFLVYFGIALSKTQRYYLPAYPFLVLFAAAAIFAMVQWAWRRGSLRLPLTSWKVRFPRWCHPGIVLPVIAVATTMFYGTAYVSVFSNEQTRVSASEWIVANVPDGSSIAWEYWDLTLPVGVPSLAGHSYDQPILHLYANEDQNKLTEIIGTLQRTEYIVLSSGRLSDSIPRMPWRYPMATRYYEALFSGELGFDQVAHFTSPPELFGIEIDDRSAEEALTVYDHPEVTIFRKSERWDAKAAWYMLNDALGHGGLDIRPVQTQPAHMMLDADDQQTVREHSSWSSIFDPGSITNSLPVVFWYLALQVLVLPMAAILWRVAPWLPDRGYAISKTVGLFGVSWVAWWLATIRWVDFGIVAISIAWLAVFAGAVLALWGRSHAFLAEMRAAWRWIAATEALLLVGYLAMAWSRAHHPDLWVPGRVGTQLQDMATFNAMARTPFFPAYDPWLADGTIHDFTFGYVPWAVMTRVTGIVPETAYSLSLATLGALVIVNGWMASSVLIARLRRGEAGWTAMGGGLLAPVLLLGIGSWRMAQRVGAGDWGPNFEGTAGDALRGLWRTITSNPTVPAGAWHSTDTFVGPGTLEFPLLSFLTGEMAIQHLSMPIVLAGVVVVFGFLSRESPDSAPESNVLGSFGGWRSAGAFLAMLGIVAGWSLAANPVQGVALLGLGGLLMLLLAGARHEWSNFWAILRDAGVAIVVVGVVAGVSIAPFLASYGTLASTTEPLAQTISSGDYIGHFGALVAIAGGYLLWQAWSLGSFARFDAGLGWIGAAGISMLAVATLGLGYLTGNLAILLLLAILLVGGLVWYCQNDASHLPILGSLTLVLVLGVVANRLRFASWTDQQNIPLQLSQMSWLVLAVVAAPMVATMVVAGWQRARLLRMAGKRGAVGAWGMAVVLVVGAGGVYPTLALPDRADDRLVQQSATLDAYTFMEGGQLAVNASDMPVAPYDLSGDLAAIEWMRENLVGLPTIAEAPGAANGWAGRISALTGFPTVIGVMPVQMQQRPGMGRLVDWRYTDIFELYASAQPFVEIEPILQDYGIQLIYVGALERATYPAASMAKFDEAVAEGHLEVVYQADEVTIYAYAGARDSREPFDP
jgi:YYY domain-containing protein